jgi:predicted aconitase with swiveling domain
MTDRDDWKMFAPLRRGEPISPQAKVVAALKAHGAGVTAATLAAELLQAGSVIGMKAPVTKRIEELLDELEQAARVERIPDGRYRVVKARAPR